jgi:LysM repeat protein
MPDYKPNQIIRVVAVVALIAAFVLVVVVVATSDGGSGGGGSGGSQAKSNGPTKRGRAAISRGKWIVRPGDTLGLISQQTGIDVDTIIQLNPNLDPQALLEGQRIALR